jgi:hypothetical protein
MATNEILQFANTASGAEILSQAAYAADPDRPDGHDPGTIARAELENKVLLQTSTIASMLGQFMADAQANNITDATAIATLAGYLKTAVKNVSLLFSVGAGTVDAITAAFTPATTALADGKFMVVRSTGANATTTPTLAVDGLTAKTIVKGNGAALAVGDIARWMLLTYDSVLDKYVLHNPASASGGGGGGILGILHVQDQKAPGTDGGSASASSQSNRALEFEAINTIGATLVGGTNYLWNIPAGTYIVNGSFPGVNVQSHRAALANSANAILMLGTSENSTGGADPVSTSSLIKGVITFNTAAQIKVVHGFNKSQATYGLGLAFNGAQNELYSDLMLQKIA